MIVKEGKPSETKIVYSDGTIIRKYSLQDEQTVRTLCCDTAYFGEPCEAFFSDKELLEVQNESPA